VAGSSEHSNEPSGSIKGMDISWPDARLPVMELLTGYPTCFSFNTCMTSTEVQFNAKALRLLPLHANICEDANRKESIHRGNMPCLCNGADFSQLSGSDSGNGVAI
jgi:hypothetical protein